MIFFRVMALTAAWTMHLRADHPASARLVWPSHPLAGFWEALESRAGEPTGSPSWPKSVGEICNAPSLRMDSAGAEANATADRSRDPLPDLCREEFSLPPLRLSIAFGAHGLGRERPLGRPFETFSPGWGSILVDPEVAGAWTDLPPLVKVELQHAFSPKAYIHFRMGLRRDLAAWHEDDLALNAPLASKELDLNEPSLGYFHWTGDFLDFTLGRFPLHWSPSPEFGLALSSAVPYHNGAQFVFKFPRLRYRFLVSSLNPWLEGTPEGGSSSEDYPVGSEEWRQRNYPNIGGTGNAHKRVYDARIKTLLAHRLEGWWGPVGLGITETNVVGGKVPDLRDMNPFGVFHNDFRDGYSNNGVSVDVLVRLPLGFSLAAEVLMDDLEYSETEGESATTSVLGYLGALRHSFAAQGWYFSQSLHAVYTNPFLYGFQQPLNTLASRHVLTSNFQEDSDPVFVDKYVVDYPIGYLRGGDAWDIWYRAEAQGKESYRFNLTLALLQKGEIGLHTPFEEYYRPHGSSPSGTVEREWRAFLEAARSWRYGITSTAGAGFRVLRNGGNVPGRLRTRASGAIGLTWAFPSGPGLDRAMVKRR